MQNETAKQPALDASELTIAVVTSRYHDDITTALREGAEESFLQAGGREDHILHVDCPGAWELPIICRALTQRGVEAPDAIVALGCVIAGQTTHDQHINQAVSGALATISVQTGCPIAFGIITCSERSQAEARAGGERGHKGREAMQAAIETATILRQLAATASKNA